MGGAQSGALNASGFSSAIQSGFLPRSSHLTYAGAFNELYYRVGARSEQILDLYYGYSNCNAPMKIPQLGTRNQFLGLFLKSKFDGQPRTRPIHVVIVLDISGSMGGQLSRKNQSGLSRLDLSRKAIKMLYKKLKPNDIFSFVTFSDDAQTLIPSEYVSNLEQNAVFAMIDRQVRMGGTVMKTGFTQALNNFKDFNYTQDGGQIEKRIVMLTDVCDNSVADQNNFIEMLSNSSIHSTIIGVSQEFRSETCEKLIEIKGFNYFCAVEDSDLQKYLFDNFDYTFFPLAYNVEIELETNKISGLDVYGTPDSAKVHTYGNFALKNKTNFTITKMQSAFPSDFVKDKEGIETTQGGLILVKLVPKDLAVSQFEGKLKLKYTSLEGKNFEQTYTFNYVPEAEEFHSIETMSQALKAFYYTYCMKYILDKMNAEETKLSDTNKSKYAQNLQELRLIAPENKKEEVQNVEKIVENFKGPEPIPEAAH